MLCEICKKNEATVHLTQIVENKMQSIDLCENCSKSKGVDDPTGFSLASLLVGLGTNTDAPPPTVENELKCPQCGYSVNDFKKAGRLGCAECYTTFSEPLSTLLKSMHKGIKHVGKTPSIGPRQCNIGEKIQLLKSELEKAIKTEDFERAAVLRDEIKALQNKSGETMA
jgi:protein arginine kinase activator